VPEQPPDRVEFPADLVRVSDEDLAALQTAAEAEFDRVDSAETLSAENVERAFYLTEGLAKVKAEIKMRADRRADAAKKDQETLAARMADMRKQVSGESGPNGGGSAVTVVEAAPPIDPEAIAAAAARGVAAVWAATQRPGSDVAERITSLALAQQHVPTPQPPREKLAVTASVDIPGIASGQKLEFDDLVAAVQRRAKSLPVSHTGDVDAGPRVATIHNTFEHTVDDRTSPAQVEELIHYLTRPEAQDALVAGGGWCAPSEIRYDFFNVACTDGLIDLPTVGINRGGIQFPTSPSLADVQLAPFVSGFSNASVPWLWTETDDQATVSGTPNKPCVRVPCPTFVQRRLECYGICVTAGNLTDDAYPEAPRNFLRLVLAAHEHAMNNRIISTMVALSSAPITGTDFATANAPAFNQLLGGLSLAAADYRAKYGMCATDVLEAVVPYWVAAVIQADLAYRTGTTEPISVTLAQINGFFADRGVRVQWVNDWQVRGSGQFGGATPLEAWPTSVTVMLYAAGTFLLGNGLTLDLGVVRDSVLNADNDFTAAWSEECHLVARVGHESRQYTISINVNGSGVAALSAGSYL
jgi:hypothetical protein